MNQMNHSPKSLNESDEIKEFTEWDLLTEPQPTSDEKTDITAVMDSVAMPNYDDISDDIPEDVATSTETSANYAATDREIYDKISLLLNKNISTAESNGNSPETIQEKRNARNIFMEAYFRSQIASEQGNTDTTLTSVLENDKSIYDKIALTYSDQFHDIPAAKHYTNLSARTTELISLVNSVRSNIENQKNPNSTHNQLANQFDRHPTPPKIPAQDNSAMFK